LEPEYTLRLVGVEYSAKHGHEICIMQLSGKNAFPKYTPRELLSNPRSMSGLSPQDAVAIAKMDEVIRQRKERHKVLEFDKNGTIVLKMPSGSEQRFSEKYLSTNRRDLLQDMLSEDAHDLGYRVGFRDGIDIEAQKKKILSTPVKKLVKYIPILRLIQGKRQ
ncbi:MAG: hypothetical protein KDJ43_13625, partial [Rhizobiaceae bacterium]|nr:hypothetical protein [Rhizobiaceae bacterium]